MKILKRYNSIKTFIEYSNGMQDIYKNTGDYSPG